MGKFDDRLADLGVQIPDAPAPAANYVQHVRVGKQVYVSGQVSRDDNGLITGVLGKDMDIDAGAAAARTCAIALIAQLKSACGGDLDQLERIIKLGGFVNSAPGFTEQPKVINGASDFLVDVFGDAGRHTRTAVGAILPLGVAVEIDGVFQLK